VKNHRSTEGTMKVTDRQRPELALSCPDRLVRCLLNIVQDELPCGVCRGAGKTKFQAPGDGVIRKCRNCSGTGKAHVTVALRIKTLKELALFPSLNQYARVAAKSLIDSNVAALRRAASEVLQHLGDEATTGCANRLEAKSGGSLSSSRAPQTSKRKN